MEALSVYACVFAYPGMYSVQAHSNGVACFYQPPIAYVVSRSVAHARAKTRTSRYRGRLGGGSAGQFG